MPYTPQVFPKSYHYNSTFAWRIFQDIQRIKLNSGNAQVQTDGVIIVMMQTKKQIFLCCPFSLVKRHRISAGKRKLTTLSDSGKCVIKHPSSKEVNFLYSKTQTTLTLYRLIPKEIHGSSTCWTFKYALCSLNSAHYKSCTNRWIQILSSWRKHFSKHERMSVWLSRLRNMRPHPLWMSQIQRRVNIWHHQILGRKSWPILFSACKLYMLLQYSIHFSISLSSHFCAYIFLGFSI